MQAEIRAGFEKKNNILNMHTLTGALLIFYNIINMTILSVSPTSGARGE
jgi:hypothetical protein